MFKCQVNQSDSSNLFPTANVTVNFSAFLLYVVMLYAFMYGYLHLADEPDPWTSLNVVLSMNLHEKFSRVFSTKTIIRKLEQGITKIFGC